MFSPILTFIPLKYFNYSSIPLNISGCKTESILIPQVAKIEQILDVMICLL